MKVLLNKILVKVEEKKEVTKAGLFIPESAQEDSKVAEVVAVGAGTKDESMDVVVGDRVVISKYSGTKVDIDNVDHLVITQNDVLVVL